MLEPWGRAEGITSRHEVILALLFRSDTAALIGLAPIIFVVPFVASLATQVKRWHDRNKSGRWTLIAQVPFIGQLWALIELGFLAGTRGANSYGLPSSGSSFDR